MENDYGIFIQNMKKKTGIDLSLYKEAQMKRRLTSLYEKKGYDSFNHFYSGMMKESDILNEFLDRMTINVTEFYRNAPRWEVLEKKIFPRLLSKNKKLRIWSAACSTGEEPYTIAMILSNQVPLSQVSIMATDLDKNAIEKAKRGIYPERSLNEIPASIKSKYFTKDGTFYRIADEIKNTVKFQQHNLLSDPYDAGFDLIICRNVLIYFTEEAKNGIYNRFSNSLKSGGVLFVGSTEQIFNPSLFDLESEDTFFYQKK
jgi:chemotaxis protein methyltransferase CheR